MKDYLGSFEIEGQYVSDEVRHTSYSVGGQGYTSIQLPLIHPGLHDHRFEIVKIRIPEGEADAYLEKTLQIVTLTAEVADLKRALWEARQKQAELKTQVIDAEARLEAVQQDTLESLSPGQLAHRILNCDMLQTAELFEVAAIELRKRASE